MTARAARRGAPLRVELLVECPACGAEPGQRCRTHRRRRPRTPHDARRRAFARTEADGAD